MGYYYIIIFGWIEEVYFVCIYVLDPVNRFVIPIQYVKIWVLLLWNNQIYYIVICRKTMK